MVNTIREEKEYYGDYSHSLTLLEIASGINGSVIEESDNLKHPSEKSFIDGPYLYKSVTFPESGSYNITLEGRLNGASVGQPFYKTISI